MGRDNINEALGLEESEGQRSDDGSEKDPDTVEGQPLQAKNQSSEIGWKGKTLIILIDVVIAWAVFGFVESTVGPTSPDDAALAAAIIVLGFAVKNWRSQFSGRAVQQSQKGNAGRAVKTATVLLIVATLAFSALNVAESAEDTARDAEDEVSYLQGEVDELRDQLRY